MSLKNNFHLKNNETDEEMESFCSSCNFFDFVVNKGYIDKKKFDEQKKVNDDFAYSFAKTTRSISQLSIQENLLQNNCNESLTVEDNGPIIDIEIPAEDELLSLSLLEPPSKRPKLCEIVEEKIFSVKETQTNDLEINNLDIKVSFKETQTDNLEMVKNETVLDSKYEKKFETSLSTLEDIKSILSERKHRIDQILNSISEANNYLDEVNNAIKVSKCSSSSTILPLPTKLSGYDSQFDFPNRDRFCKLPVMIENKSGKIHKRTGSIIISENKFKLKTPAKGRKETVNISSLGSSRKQLQNKGVLKNSTKENLIWTTRSNQFNRCQ